MAKDKDRDKPREAELELPVTYGGLSVGDKTCRIGMSISRGNYTVSKADKQLCERRLTVELLCRSNGAPADQGSLPGMDNDRKIKAIGDVKGYSVSGKAISFGITFVLSGVNVEELSHFPKRDGRVTVFGIEDIPDGDNTAEDETEE